MTWINMYGQYLLIQNGNGLLVYMVIYNDQLQNSLIIHTNPKRMFLIGNCVASKDLQAKKFLLSKIYSKLY